MKRNSRALVVIICVVSAIQAVLADDSNHRDPRSDLLLKSPVLCPPVELTGKSGKLRVTSFEIRGRLPAKGDGQATVLLDQSEYSFNEFGDSKRTRTKRGLPRAAVLRRLEWRFDQLDRSPQLAKRYRLYVVSFKDGSHSNGLSLVIGDKFVGTHRLIVRENGRILRIVSMKGRPTMPAVLKDRPVDKSIGLSGFAPREDAAPYRVSITGTIGEKGRLLFDRNHLQFDQAGNVRLSTLAAYAPQEVLLKQVSRADPSKRGRRLVELLPTRKSGQRYFLVQSSTEAGEHRLIICDDKSCVQILRMEDGNRKHFRYLLAQLEHVPAKERDAILQLQKTIGYGLLFTTHGGHVISVRIPGRSNHDFRAISLVLTRLTHLGEISLFGLRVNSNALENLSALKRLKALHFDSCEIEEKGFEYIKELSGLQQLHCYECRGITNTSLSYLNSLKSLKSIWIWRDPSAKSPNVGITGSGLRFLKSLTQLESLKLIGHDVSDDGLKELSGLRNLKSLGVSGEDVTDTGLVHLKGLIKLRYLKLYDTSVSTDGVAALREKIPKLMIFHPSESRKR